MTSPVGSDAILDRLLTLHPKVIDLTLERLTRLLDRLGNPERDLPPVVHVAGTNGKGSTLAVMRAGIEAAGLTAHAYTSPHLARFHERIRVAGELIGEDALTALLEECETANEGAQITFFEITTAAALLAFARSRADYCLLEVGLGGRLDATNVISSPALTVITPISIDHQQFLGETIEQIASEKAGILKPEVRCVVAPQDPAAETVLAMRAERMSAPLLLANRDWSVFSVDGKMIFDDDAGRLEMPPPRLPGGHQIENAGTAVAVLRQLGLPDEAIAQAPAGADWSARIQRLTVGALAERVERAGAELWLDGGHNAAAGVALAAHFKTLPPAEFHLVCGMIDTKDPVGFLLPFVGLAKRLFAVPVPDSDAGIPPFVVSQIASDAGLSAAARDDPHAAVDDALKSGAERILICGSLYLAGAVLREGAA